MIDQFRNFPTTPSYDDEPEPSLLVRRAAFRILAEAAIR